MKSQSFFLFLLSGCIYLSHGEDVVTTKVFVLPIEPKLFNWTTVYNPEGFWYRTSLSNLPDLPNWMTYHYSKRHRKGFIYGVSKTTAENIQIEIVALNRETYETRRNMIFLNVTEKQDPAKYEVRLKIDNLNVEDIFDPHRLFSLLRIFTTVLWPDSADNLYMTFLSPSVKLGARLPLHPNEGEGIVVHLGSSVDFSDLLVNLQEEVKPLWKLGSCPRDFKRSTVDRHFRPNGFLIDWCSFRLLTVEESVSDKAHYQEPSVYQKLDQLELVKLSDIPTRNYDKELISVLIVPSISLFALIGLLSVILCFHHDSFDLTKENESTIVQYEAVQRATSILRDGNGITPDFGSNLNSEREDTCRPSPPPYSATKRFMKSDITDEPKTWYC